MNIEKFAVLVTDGKDQWYAHTLKGLRLFDWKTHAKDEAKELNNCARNKQRCIKAKAVKVSISFVEDV